MNCTLSLSETNPASDRQEEVGKNHWLAAAHVGYEFRKKRKKTVEYIIRWYLWQYGLYWRSDINWVCAGGSYQ